MPITFVDIMCGAPALWILFLLPTAPFIVRCEQVLWNLVNLAVVGLSWSSTAQKAYLKHFLRTHMLSWAIRSQHYSVFAQPTQVYNFYYPGRLTAIGRTLLSPLSAEFCWFVCWVVCLDAVNRFRKHCIDVDSFL